MTHALEGFGASVTGGAGGSTVHVTNLNSTGAGSYRNALLSGGSGGPRTVVFDVSGTINLFADGAIELKNGENGSGGSQPGAVYDDLTIDGSTAPDQGVQIVGDSTIIRCDNVLVKHMKYRCGDQGPTTGRDSLSIDTATNVAVTDCSLEVGDDGDCDIVNSSTGVTVQWCIIGPCLSSGSMLIKYGSTITASIHHNAFFSSARFPECGGPAHIDWVNNIMYRNYNPDALSLWPPDEGVIEANVVNNRFKYGSSAGNTGNSRPLYFYAARAFSAGSSFYVAANDVVGPTDTILTTTQSQIYEQDSGSITFQGSPFAYPAITTTTPTQAYADVMAGAGARLPCGLDAMDTTILGYITTGTGLASAYNDVSELGGYPDLTIPCATTTPSLVMSGKIVLSGKVVIT